MPLSATYRKIGPTEIDLQDRTFALAPPEKSVPSFSVGEISRLALLAPPVLVPGDGGRLLIGTGRHLLEPLGNNDGIGCLLLPADTEPAAILELALAEILAHRPATALEEAQCLAKAEAWLGMEEAARRFGPRLILFRRLGPGKLSRLLQLPPAQANALQEGRLEPDVACRLLELTPGDADSTFTLLDTLRLSSANQKKLMEILMELSRRSGRDIAALLDSAECREILAAPGNNPSRLGARLMQWLNTLRFPRLTAAEEDFRLFVAGLNPPAGVTLEHSPSFEKDSLRLTIEFRDSSELAGCWPELREILDRLK